MDAAGPLILPLASTLGDVAERLGIVVAAGLVAAALLVRSGRARGAAMAGALLLTPVLLVAEIWETEQFRSLRDEPLVAVAAGLAGLGIVALLAAAMHRRPALFPVLAVAALPFRVPIAVGGSTANLLVPLYLVVAAGALAFLIPRLQGRPDAKARPPRALEKVLAGVVVLYAVQASYSSDFSRALEQVVFFYVPFALLFLLLTRVTWSRRLLLASLGVLTGLALIFAAIGFVEYAARDLLLNPKVISSNQIESYFRVNSLFFDPNIYGRFLAVAMLALAAVLAWSTRRRDVLLAAAALAFLWGGLVLTFSQSSFAALLLGLAVLAGLRWSTRRTVAACAGAAALALVFVIAFPSAVKLDLDSSRSVDDATSGRYELVKGGVELWGEAPVHGHGPGSFEEQYREAEKASSERAASASHTIPVTVAAEQGLIGLAAYLALLVAAFGRLFGGARGSLARAAVAAGFAALVLHTLLYAAFLEDPLTWTLLGAGAALAAADADRRHRERHPLG